MPAKTRHPGYEPAGYGRTLLLFLLLFVVAVVLLFAALNGQWKASEVSAWPAAIDTSSFQEPVLQIDAVADLHQLQAEQETQLNSYGWVDKGAGVAHIPIDRAIELLAEQGLPSRKSSQ